MHKIQSSSIHIAINFSHSSPAFSTFWNIRSQTDFYKGKDVKKYPFFGLAEIGNVTVKNPSCSFFLNAWQPGSPSLVYVQFYTPFTKLFTSKPFENHPFLFTLMLGKEYVQGNPTFKRFYESTEKNFDYLSLVEAIILHLTKATSRCEVVLTSGRVDEVLHVNLVKLAGIVKRASLLVQVSIDITVWST